MANHGKCKDCWWYEVINKPYKVVMYGTLIDKEGNGRCYMNKSTYGEFTETNDNSYCYDYCNRDKEEKNNGTLSDWKKLHKIK